MILETSPEIPPSIFLEIILIVIVRSGSINRVIRKIPAYRGFTIHSLLYNWEIKFEIMVIRRAISK